jgi:hypothetical protein
MRGVMTMSIISKYVYPNDLMTIISEEGREEKEIKNPVKTGSFKFFRLELKKQVTVFLLPCSELLP